MYFTAEPSGEIKNHAEPCFRAMQSKDPRFDGRFFVGITSSRRSTRIYCRPSCRAHAPKFENCAFFLDAAAARAAGFRPCQRCRPETRPGTPAWSGTSATVSRALRLIDEGVLDESPMSGLADSLGIGERHLRRLFLERVGVSPLAVAQARRLIVAKRLIDETDMRMIDVAMGSGYRSLRRFNGSIRGAYGTPPSEMRKLRRPARGSGATVLTVRLPCTSPYDWQSMAADLAARALPCVENVDAHCYRRAFEIDGVMGSLVAAPSKSGKHLVAQIRIPELSKLGVIVERLRRVFDLGAEIPSIWQTLLKDGSIRHLALQFPGVRIPGAWDPFELIVQSIVYRDERPIVARSLLTRLIQTHGSAVNSEFAGRGSTHAFPAPDALANAGLLVPELSHQTRHAIARVAQAVAGKQLNSERLTDLDEAMHIFRDVCGLAAPTANYIAMRAFQNPDAFPLGEPSFGCDGSAVLGADQIAAMETRAERWRPWRAYGLMLLQGASRYSAAQASIDRFAGWKRETHSDDDHRPPPYRGSSEGARSELRHLARSTGRSCESARRIMDRQMSQQSGDARQSRLPRQMS
jgi:AraC family transcriptional regulator, regulatory protein of adaptative response / DNA-3-methyladenine glycosylase II